MTSHTLQLVVVLVVAGWAVFLVGFLALLAWDRRAERRASDVVSRVNEYTTGGGSR